MCGIAGIVSKETQVTEEMIHKMTDAIAHRGPDGEGRWINSSGSAGLGHRRLSIIDLSENAKQPMHYGNGRYSITFNGEIYNYLEIREQLLKKGYHFQTQSDTEVLIALYALKGVDCLKELDGMFAFAIWDEQDQKLFCGRDRFGEKPFYYAFERGKRFVFGSEMKALWATGLPKKRNDRMVFNFLNERLAVSDPDQPYATFYSNIFKLEAAHYLILERNLELKKARYWDLDLTREINPGSNEEAVSQFRKLLIESVALRLRSDVPVGSSLSGGLDSSTIVCIINDLNKDNKQVQKTFSARFKDFDQDEGFFMQKVIDATRVQSHFVWPNEYDISQELKRLCYFQEEPFGGGSTFAQWKVMELARKSGIHVLLDGQGADEILAGYKFYFLTFLHELFRAGSESYEPELAAYRERHNPTFKSYGREDIPASKQQASPMVKYLKNLGRSAYRTVFPAQQKSRLLNGNNLLTREFRSQFTNKDLIGTPFEGGLKEQLYNSSCRMGLQDLLRFADRCAMAHGVEVRLPFLSHTLVEYVFALPANYKIRNGWSKYILRKAFEDIVPPEISWRVDKIGYAAPQRKWLNDPAMHDIIHDSVRLLEQEKIINPGFNSKDHPDLDWSLLILANTVFSS